MSDGYTPQTVGSDSDLKDFADLLYGRNPRTLSEMIAADRVFMTYIVRSYTSTGDERHVELEDEKGYHGMSVTLQDREGWFDHLAIDEGDEMRLWGGMGHRVYGWAVKRDAEPVLPPDSTPPLWCEGYIVGHYETPWERFAQRMSMLAGFDRDKRENGDADRKQIAVWMEQITEPRLRARYQRFKAADPMFDIDMGTYEVYPMLMAQRIYTHLYEADSRWEQYDEFSEPSDARDALALEVVRAFHDLPYEEQAAVAAPNEDYGVSGHQFDSALACVRHLLAGRDV